VAKAEEAVEKMATQLVFGQVPPRSKKVKRRQLASVVMRVDTLLDVIEGQNQMPLGQAVQLAFL
jgi:hypothetical protein